MRLRNRPLFFESGGFIMKINGSDIHLPEDTPLSVILKERGYNRDRVATELNGNIVPRKDYDRTVITDGDILEIVGMVGGG